MPDFCHLHNHTQYSLLDGASHIAEMIRKAVDDGQRAIAITDHGNMFGVFHFVSEAQKQGIKPIIGCEFYLVEDRHKKSFLRSKNEVDKRYHQLLLAKNEVGYRNLMKLCSLGYIEGLYGKYPRIDKELIEQYSEGLIATSCCIAAEIPQAIIAGDMEKAHALVRWWKDLLGEDFYIEIQRQEGLDNIDGSGISQEQVNQVLLQLARHYDIKVIATNDAHYVDREDWKPHDVLLCINTSSLLSDTDRFRFASSDFYLKTRSEMQERFADLPQALDNTLEIADKVANLQLERDILLPAFPVPEEFDSQLAYLRELVYRGAQCRYSELTDEVRRRIDYELEVIGKMGFEGYFLIVQDFIHAAKQMGVSVGPGRGSAAGSAVAYCLGITNVDPLKYHLLFERFLNPERVTMPDMDIDFDDEGRQKVIDYVVKKYGFNQVAQIITFNTMAARLAIRDVARVLGLPLDETDRLAKMVPGRPGVMLRKILSEEALSPEEFRPEEIENIKTLRKIWKSETKEGETLSLARQLEGSIRNFGIHAAGVIIAPEDITNYIPVCVSKDKERENGLLVTQYDGSVVEKAGMLKMDFLGLKTLTIIKDTIENIVQRYGEERRFDPDTIPLDDAKTFELFQRGEMTGIFQFESAGMRRYLRELKPTVFEDLIAMTALYRPGPMDFIPVFINRKHGREPVEYPHPWLEDILKPTYGIMVYQEQIMQTAQVLAGYSLGEADMLRRAMGKKKREEMERHRKIFVEGAAKKGIDKAKAEEIFDIMARFASYGFNRSHATAYSVLSFQTAYLKAHYPAEFMASVLTHNKNDISKLNFLLQECKRMNLKVLPPDVNESQVHFSVNRDGHIRFGLAALKGVGEIAVEAIIREREANGPYRSLLDMTRRLDTRTVNKKAYESLVLGGALDCFGIARARYFLPSDRYESFLEHAVQYGIQVQRVEQDNSMNLFGEAGMRKVREPEVPQGEEWPLITRLEREKSVAGIYLSGHPLDDFSVELKYFISCPIAKLSERPNQHLTIAGVVTRAQHRISKKGTRYGQFEIEDYTGSLKINLYSKDYVRFSSFFEPGQVLYLYGRYEKGWQREEEYIFRVEDVGYLEDLSQKIKEVTLVLPLQDLTEEVVESARAICSEHPGKHRVKWLVVDEDNKHKLRFVSGNTRVHVEKNFIEKMQQLGIRAHISKTA